ncbi:uncharacterized protein PHALS_10313 [Plasmopara halstedii]|uniref:Uncharacterized protein n=1 Tax=Plasmopara halstedii TaxID=4781 RepID=A0A0P1AGB3_PLAHL|nr:uncharacterized protein PHALS_10313 [Plasmopara halstedii]CEG40094.1 hypothetical protein PHALS_10313 [Plasmopara halstedii]|eukprot:XP_024576463.1 hypothetical protein PHALS_10313 [Plasmopara halstedii]
MQIFWSEPKPSVPDVKRQRSEKLDSRELDMLAALVPQLENGVERMVGKILDIPTRSLNISVPYGLYIRQEYWDLYVIIKQQLRTNRLLRRFLVLGTSGVGKSVFGVFLLLVFLTERKNVAYRGRDDKLIYFTWDIFGYKCSQTPYAGCNYDGLFDGKGTGEALQLRKFNCAFLFADSCPQSYNEFAKTLCFEAYMEPWTKIECDMFADAINLNGKDDWLRTVNLVGGKPSVMVQSRHESEYLVHHVEASTPKNLEDDKYEVQPRKQNRIDNWTDSDSFYLYRNENASSRAYPATFFAVETIMKGHFNNYSNKIRDLMRAQASIDQSWRGNELLHELSASKFCMKSLEGNGVGTVTQHGPLNAAFEAIEASFEIRNELMLYISMSNYFPATIDGVLVIPQDGRIILNSKELPVVMLAPRLTNLDPPALDAILLMILLRSKKKAKRGVACRIT